MLSIVRLSTGGHFFESENKQKRKEKTNIHCEEHTHSSMVLCNRTVDRQTERK